MKFEKPVPITQIAKLINAEIIGRHEGAATGINEIHRVQEGDLVFVDHPKYYKKCIESPASYIIINQKTDVPPGKTLLLVNDPFEAYLQIVQYFRPFRPSSKQKGEAASIGKDTVIMHGALIGNHVVIGNGCIIYPNVVLMDYCIIGNNVIIQSNSTIGSDAFYYNKRVNREIHYKKMLSCGRVVIEDNVEIGAGCTIDRGVTGDTLIGAGTKIDNLVHLGHDTIIGKNCLIAAQVGIAGASTVEDNVMLWGQVGVNKTIIIGRGAEVMGQSGVTSSIEGGKRYWGTPIQEAAAEMRDAVWIKRIPELWKKVM
ncbi:MAG: UDP-3-O-(3-hydroxymyristoyl)glucosamine N-acyltransferase [Chitinophagaceae bacterium]|nr:UDP-3-O-(3-hydroxymyristoyl)glucosamine N-acyltransferase [Chitinophagaceae bacterium]